MARRTTYMTGTAAALWIVLVTVLGTASCASGELPKYSNPVSPSFPVLGWGALNDPALRTRRAYRLMEEAGITLACGFLTDDKAIDAAIDSAAGTGVKLVLWTPAAERKDLIGPLVGKYGANPTVAGYLLCDEPKASAFPSLLPLCRAVAESPSGQLPFANLFPIYATREQLGAASYTSYLSRYLEQSGVPYLSFDNYPIVRRGDRTVMRGDFYDNLETVMRVARSFGVPFWSFCLSTPHMDFPPPTLGQLSVEAFSALAYGAKGIQYYTYGGPPPGKKSAYTDTPVDAHGNPTRSWKLLRRVNATIQALAPIFNDADVQWVAHTGKTIPEGTVRLNSRLLPPQVKDLQSRGAGVAVSFFNALGRGFLMAVNRDFEHSQDIGITLASPVEEVGHDGVSVPLQPRRARSMRIDPGSFILLRL